ncbi:hypothetical protein KV396_07630 [Microbacterium galbinum]|uniref:PD(D/E)XK endonuclease domain-containing protein n=2 Tax=Microbacterium galbinum TaxID=2851646 RepID=A0ABY4IU17_9MICO|nr:hypothetical protein KV396_07630 [Microbacterium galbinum]
MVGDTKQTKTIGEHLVASELARRGWAPALTRDGLERTDILAVHTGHTRRMVEIQVKSARSGRWDKANWPLGDKSQQPSAHEREYFVMVASPQDVSLRPRCFVLPRAHVAAAAWIAHMDWLTTEGIPAGKRNAPVSSSRVSLPVFAAYEDRWDLLHVDESECPVLLPAIYRDYAQSARVGLPPGHSWWSSLPEW